MSHNTPGEVVMHSEDERFLKNLARRAFGRKVPLSFFERQQAVDLGLSKAMDVHGNLDLNEASNLMTQASCRRISPNVRASESTREGWTIRGKATRADLKKAMGTELNDGHFGMHARFCKDSSGNDVQGRNCRVCHGVGFHAFAKSQADKAVGTSVNKARDVVDGNIV